jgi:hypothetical protein
MVLAIAPEGDAKIKFLTKKEITILAIIQRLECDRITKYVCLFIQFNERSLL